MHQDGKGQTKVKENNLFKEEKTRNRKISRDDQFDLHTISEPHKPHNETHSH